jgi:uncharacterized protein
LAQNTIIAVGGLIRSGKSTLAVSLFALLRELGAARYIATDIIRKKLKGLAATEPVPREMLTQAFDDETHVEFNRVIAEATGTHDFVVCDACFWGEHQRRELEEIAANRKSVLIPLWIEASPNLRRERAISCRVGFSNAIAQDVDRQLSYDLGNITWARINGNGTAEDSLEQTKVILSRNNVVLSNAVPSSVSITELYL